LLICVAVIGVGLSRIKGGTAEFNRWVGSSEVTAATRRVREERSDEALASLSRLAAARGARDIERFDIRMMLFRTADTAGIPRDVSTPVIDESLRTVPDGLDAARRATSSPKRSGATAAGAIGVAAEAVGSLAKLVVTVAIVGGAIFGWNYVHTDEFKLKCVAHKASHTVGAPDPVSFPDNVLCDMFYS
jgi:hypothetical protein